MAYYWSPPTWAKVRGFDGAAEALGTDFGDAKRKCDDVLNPYFEEWRTGGAGERIDRTAHGTFDWMVEVYKSSPPTLHFLRQDQGDMAVPARGARGHHAMADVDRLSLE